MMSDCTGWLIFSRKPTETDKWCLPINTIHCIHLLKKTALSIFSMHEILTFQSASIERTHASWSWRWNSVAWGEQDRYIQQAIAMRVQHFKCYYCVKEQPGYSTVFSLFIRDHELKSWLHWIPKKAFLPLSTNLHTQHQPWNVRIQYVDYWTISNSGF